MFFILLFTLSIVHFHIFIAFDSFENLSRVNFSELFKLFDLNSETTVFFVLHFVLCFLILQCSI